MKQKKFEVFIRDVIRFGTKLYVIPPAIDGDVLACCFIDNMSPKQVYQEFILEGVKLFLKTP